MKEEYYSTQVPVANFEPPKPATRPPSQFKTKQYKHEVINLSLSGHSELTDRLNEGWEILRADRVREGCILYIIRKEVI